jgi:hypothetical protein
MESFYHRYSPDLYAPIYCYKVSFLVLKGREMITKLITAIVIVLTLGVVQTTNVFASHSSSPTACEGDGLYDGKNGPFSQGLYEMCGDTYYEAFIEGCMSVEGNTRDDCKSATDSGE